MEVANATEWGQMKFVGPPRAGNEGAPLTGSPYSGPLRRAQPLEVLFHSP